MLRILLADETMNCAQPGCMRRATWAMRLPTEGTIKLLCPGHASEFWNVFSEGNEIEAARAAAKIRPPEGSNGRDGVA